MCDVCERTASMTFVGTQHATEVCKPVTLSASGLALAARLGLRENMPFTRSSIGVLLARACVRGKAA